MSPQIAFQLKRILLLAALAALGSVGANLSDLNLDPTYYILASAAVAALIQLITGIQDTQRAMENRLIPSDVGYDLIQSYRKEPVITPKGYVR